MNATTLGVVLTGIAALIGLAAWLFPRAPRTANPVASPTPQPASVPPVPQPDAPTGLLVSISLAMLATEPDMCIMVEAANPNVRPRRVVAVGLQLENKRQVAFTQPGSDRGIPCLLNETDKVHYWASAPHRTSSLRVGFRA